MKKDKLLGVIAFSDKRKNLLIYLLEGPKTDDNPSVSKTYHWQ